MLATLRQNKTEWSLISINNKQRLNKNDDIGQCCDRWPSESRGNDVRNGSVFATHVMMMMMRMMMMMNSKTYNKINANFMPCPVLILLQNLLKSSLPRPHFQRWWLSSSFCRGTAGFYWRWLATEILLGVIILWLSYDNDCPRVSVEGIPEGLSWRIL